MTELLFTSRRLVAADRCDRLLHALAQLPDEVTLTVAGEGPARAGLERLAAAYGLEERVTFSAHPPPPGDAVVVYPSPENLANAPVRPEAAAHAASFRNMAELVLDVSPGGPSATVRGRDELLEGERVALLTNQPTHYRVPLWNDLARRLAAAGCELRVLSTAPPRADRPWMVRQPIEFDHVQLRSTGLRGAGVPLDLERRLRGFRPTLVVSPGFSPLTTGRAAAFAERHGAAFGIWNGEVPWTHAPESRARLARRRWILRRSRFGLCYGSVAADFLQPLVPELPRVLVRNSTPLPSAAGDRPDDGPVRVLAVARAVRGKGLEVLVDAFRLLAGSPCRLTIAGGGAELDALRAEARDVPDVELIGAVSSDRVAALYEDADVFVFPTRSDVFGLVLVEAMGGGVAPVVSSYAGATGDLVAPGRTGVLVESHEPRDWAQAIEALVEDAGRRRRIGEAARDFVAERWTIAHSVDAWVAGLRLGALARRGVAAR